MEDDKIVDLYMKRSEDAISETEKKYGRYCHSIAYNILYSNEEASECVNETYLRAWRAIPPTIPTRLSSFLAKITRNLAIDRYTKFRALKRTVENEVILEEVDEILTDTIDTSTLTDEIALKNAINDFVAHLTHHTRVIFVRRYWYMSSVADIARDCKMSEANVKVILHRTRKKFKEHLLAEGIIV